MLKLFRLAHSELLDEAQLAAQYPCFTLHWFNLVGLHKPRPSSSCTEPRRAGTSGNHLFEAIPTSMGRW